MQLCFLLVENGKKNTNTCVCVYICVCQFQAHETTDRNTQPEYICSFSGATTPLTEANVFEDDKLSFLLRQSRSFLNWCILKVKKIHIQNIIRIQPVPSKKRWPETAEASKKNVLVAFWGNLHCRK